MSSQANKQYKDEMKEYGFINEAEESAIQRFLQDETMQEAVKKVLLAGVYFDGRIVEGKPSDPNRNLLLGLMTQPNVSMLPDQDYGNRMRSVVDAISILESSFQRLQDFETVEVSNKKKKVPR